MLRRLPIDASSLWTYPANQLVIRFLDLNDFRQISFVDRIKKTARQSKIRNNPEITNDKIFECVKEINPIIFIEGSYSNTIRNRKHYRRFNKNSCEYLSGFVYRSLCKTIYKMLCIRRPLTKAEVRTALYISCQGTEGDWYGNCLTLLDTHFPEENETNRISTEEIGQDELTRISSRLNPRMPEEMNNNSTFLYQNSPGPGIMQRLIVPIPTIIEQLLDE